LLGTDPGDFADSFSIDATVIFDVLPPMCPSCDNDFVDAFHCRGKNGLIIQIPRHPFHLFKFGALDLLHDLLGAPRDAAHLVTALEEIKDGVLSDAARGADHKNQLLLARRRLAACSVA
jgi:hypothetical protein